MSAQPLCLPSPADFQKYQSGVGGNCTRQNPNLIHTLGSPPETVTSLSPTLSLAYFQSDTWKTLPPQKGKEQSPKPKATTDCANFYGDI
jgi:hypothetical protein